MNTRHERPVDRRVTAELLARYDRPGPRYTSYPTAVEFHDGFTPESYAERLRQADQQPEEPLSLYMHLPFCEHRCLFCGCHVIISPDKSKAAPYLDLLRREIDLVAGYLPHRRTFSQLHLGGGTPTYQSPEQLDGLLRHLLASFSPAPGAELAVEVDPRVTSKEHLDTLAGLGFNRISLGVQDFTPAVQEAIERIQSVEQTASLVEHARSLGFRGVNLDLIYGLPHQTPDAFEAAIDIVLGLRPDRLAVYSFALVPWIRGHQKSIQEEDLPDRDTKLALFALTRERLLSAGYEPIGMDHFALPDDELAVARKQGRLRRNFQGYAVIPASDVIGLGISAIGDVQGAYVQNEKKLSTYEQALDEGRLPVHRGVARSADDEARRLIIHRLMCNFELNIPEVERELGVDFASTFAEDLELLRPHVEEGMVEITPERIRATSLGELFVRNLAMCFDRYQREKHEDGDKPVFSRTV